MTLAELVADRDLAAVAATLDGLAERERASVCTSADAGVQRRLWELASAGRRRDGQLIRGAGDGSSERYAGRNSLGMLSRFEKRFFRSRGRIFGYNAHALRPVIGPGYFGVTVPDEGGLRFDYRDLPPSAPQGWPGIAANDGWLARPVYGGLVDEVVWIATDVLIGAAFRAGAPLNSFFILARIAE